MQYLKKRTANFYEGEKAVTLLIDEVYTANRVEYQNGTFVGLTEDGACAQTVLTFTYSLFVKAIKTWFDKVMKCFDEIFFVVPVSVDNHICNR